VVNIRVLVRNFSCSHSLRRLLRRNQARFRVETGPAHIDEAKEGLYQYQKQAFKGYIFDTLEEFLFAQVPEGLFNTHEIRVYEGDKLVAASFFDVGKQAVASLIGLYDPAYRRHSLGLYTMLQEVLWAQESGKQFFYPGYVLLGNDSFDYKMRLGHLQYYDWQGRWHRIEQLPEECFASELLQAKYEALETALLTAGISYRVHLYPPFSLAYLEKYDQGFVSSPLVVHCFPEVESQYLLLIEFETESQEYLLSWVSVDDESLDYSEVEFSDDFFGEDPFSKSLLVREDQLLQTSDLGQLIDQVRQFSKINWQL
jgi:arginine-tRNA-protein transferase